MALGKTSLKIKKTYAECHVMWHTAKYITKKKQKKIFAKCPAARHSAKFPLTLFGRQAYFFLPRAGGTHGKGFAGRFLDECRMPSAALGKAFAE